MKKSRWLWLLPVLLFGGLAAWEGIRAAVLMEETGIPWWFWIGMRG
jgi:hypothetical protein